MPLWGSGLGSQSRVGWGKGGARLLEKKTPRGDCWKGWTGGRSSVGETLARHKTQPPMRGRGWCWWWWSHGLGRGRMRAEPQYRTAMTHRVPRPIPLGRGRDTGGEGKGPLGRGRGASRSRLALDGREECAPIQRGEEGAGKGTTK
eukprot:scaffold6677_cov86-Isochrysis_galbana.AAC.1